MTIKEKLLSLDVYDSPRECAAAMVEAHKVITDLENEIEQLHYEMKEERP